MVEIISKRDSPRREDAELRKMLTENRATITRIADHISAGAYSARKAPKQAPKASGLIFHDLSSPASAAEARPQVRVSLNGRVILVDENTSRQMHHIGEIRARDGVEFFALATKENGFFAPVDDDIALALRELDHIELSGPDAEEQLAAQIGEKLGIK
jgi:hypothetical protein